MNRAYRTCFFAAIAVAPLFGQQLSSVAYTATFNNIGIDLTLSAAASAGSSVSAAIGDIAEPAGWRECHPLSQLAPNRFAGSIFGLDANTKYLIRLRTTLLTGDRIDTVITRDDVFAAPGGTVYHVAKNGNDVSNGTSAEKAFASLAHALSVAQAGATILLHEGHFYESVTPPRSGTRNRPILIRNAPGETAVIDGRDTSFRPSWTAHDAAAGIYRTACTKQPRLAFHNGQHLFASPSLGDLVKNTWNMPSGFFCDGSWMYVRFPHSGAPAPADTVQIPAFTTGITCSGRQYIQFKGLEIRYFGLDDYSRGIYFDGSSNNLVDSCFLHHSGIGVAFKRMADFNTVQNCRFTESPIDTWNWSAVKEGSGYYEAGGVYVYGSSSVNSGNVVRNNHFLHMFDGSHLYSEDASGLTVNFDFHDNIIEYVNDDCIETDGVGSNCRIYGNTFRKFLTGVSVAPASGGPTYIFRNLFTGWETHSGYEGYPVKFNVDSDLSTDWVYLYHNTCYTSTAGQPGFLFKDYSNWNNVVSRNNIFAGTDYAFESRPDQNPVDFDYDAFYASASGRLVDWAGAKYGTIAAFSAATGQETHGIAGEPRFVDASGGDFHLSQTSPLIDKGIPIPNINDGFIGKGPDIGCFEYGSAGAVPSLKRERPDVTLTAYGDRATGGVIIRFTRGRAGLPADIKLFRLDGQCIYSRTTQAKDGSLRLPAPAVPSGIYCAQAAVGADVYRCYFSAVR